MRAAFRYIEANDYTKYRFLLLELLAISIPINTLIMRNFLASRFHVSDGDFLVIIVSAIFGIGILIIYADVMKRVGRYLGGTASSDMILKVLAYSALPLILNVVILFFQAVMLSSSTLENLGYFTLALLWLSKGVQLLLYFWWLLVLVRGLSEVQKAPAYTAFMTFVFSNIFIRMMIWLAVAIFSLLQHVLR
jgi:hypothetical protein